MEKIKGTIIKTTFRNNMSGFSYVIVRKNESDLITLKGVLSEYADGTPFIAEINEPDKGKDLYSIESFRETSIGFSRNTIEGFLRSLEMNGGKLSFSAIKILLDFVAEGKDLFDITARMLSGLDTEEQLLIDRKIRIPHLERQFRELLQSLVPDGKIQYYLCSKFVREKMDFAMSLFKRRPREVCVRELGMDFATAVAVNKSMGLASNDDDTVSALGLSILSRTEKSGSTCMPTDQFKREIQETIYQIEGATIDGYRIEKALMHNNFIVSRDGFASFGNTLHNEEVVALRIRHLLENRRELFTVDELNNAIRAVEEKEHIQYADAQKAAFKLLRCTGLGVLTGGPGTGKTTVLKGLLNAYLRKYPLSDVVMASPTGRAAQRMTESTGHDAMTIHRLVGIGRNQRGTNQLPGDMVIIDESSMLDAEMAAWLLMAISEKSLVLFVGDVDQLPSVGAGNILKDLIQSNVVPVCRLQTVFRQSGESSIVVNANKINKGESDLRVDDTFIIHEVKDDKAIVDVMTAVAKEALKHTDDPVYGVQILATAHKGDAGINAANSILQNMINPRVHGMKAMTYGNVEFREGDKVITTQNRYEDNYFNGDIGVITQIGDSKIEIQLSDKTVYLQKHNLQDLSLGYCISIHKSQGSEFDHAIILLPEQPSVMLRRNLLYTAVTRAKKTCTLISSGSGSTIGKCARNIDNTRRVTLLPYMLQNPEAL